MRPGDRRADGRRGARLGGGLGGRRLHHRRHLEGARARCTRWASCRRAAAHAGRAGRGRAAAGGRVRAGPRRRPGPARDGGGQHLRRPPAQLAQGAARGARVAAARSWPCPTRRSWTAMRGRRAARRRVRRAGGRRGPGRAARGGGGAASWGGAARALAVVTGSGLKDVRTAMRAVGKPVTCPAGRRGGRALDGARRSRAARVPHESSRAAPGRDARRAGPAARGGADLRVEGDRIVERGPRSPPGGRGGRWTCPGAVVLPGLVNAHTHLYSALARGMPGPAPPPRNFVEILEQRLVAAGPRPRRGVGRTSPALVGAIEAALSGTTLLIDHHSSPAFIRGSLATLRAAAGGGGPALGALLRGDRPQRAGRAATPAWRRTRPSWPTRRRR